MDYIGLFYCILTALCWAIGPVFLRKSLDTFDNTEINAIRCIGFVSVTALFCITTPSLLVWKYGFPLLLLTFMITMIGNFIGDLCYFVAIDNIGLGRAISTANSYPIIVALISTYWLGESTSLELWIGTLIIILGLTLLNCTKKSAVPPSSKIRSNAKGFLMGLMASLSWGLMLSVQKFMISTYMLEPITYTFWRAVSISLIAWGYWFFSKNKEARMHVFQVGLRKWISPLWAGAFGLALGGIAFASALEIVPVSLASPITAANPIIAAIIAKFAFKERLSPIQWVGIVMVIIGGIKVTS